MVFSSIKARLVNSPTQVILAHPGSQDSSKLPSLNQLAPPGLSLCFQFRSFVPQARMTDLKTVSASQRKHLHPLIIPLISVIQRLDLL